MSSGSHQRSDFFSLYHATNVSGLVHVEDDHGQVVVLAQAHGGQVHHLQPLFQNVHVGDVVVFHRVLEEHWICVVDTLNLSALEQHIGLNFHGAQARGRVGGEEGISDARGKDHNAAF